MSKGENRDDPKKDPVFQKVVRKFLDTPPRPKKAKKEKPAAKRQDR